LAIIFVQGIGPNKLIEQVFIRTSLPRNIKCWSHNLSDKPCEVKSVQVLLTFHAPKDHPTCSWRGLFCKVYIFHKALLSKELKNPLDSDARGRRGGSYQENFISVRSIVIERSYQDIIVSGYAVHMMPICVRNPVYCYWRSPNASKTWIYFDERNTVFPIFFKEEYVEL
jgi:hypothetical protein